MVNGWTPRWTLHDWNFIRANRVTHWNPVLYSIVKFNFCSFVLSCHSFHCVEWNGNFTLFIYSTRRCVLCAIYMGLGGMHSTSVNGLNFISFFCLLLYDTRLCVCVCLCADKYVCCFEYHHCATIYRSLINLVAIEWQTEPVFYYMLCDCVCIVCARFYNFLLLLLFQTVCGSEQIAISATCVQYMYKMWTLKRDLLLIAWSYIMNGYQFYNCQSVSQFGTRQLKWSVTECMRVLVSFFPSCSS